MLLVITTEGDDILYFFFNTMLKASSNALLFFLHLYTICRKMSFSLGLVIFTIAVYLKRKDVPMAISRYPTSPADDHSTGARLLYVTHSKYEGDWNSFPHSHYFAELCYIRSGQGYYLIEDQKYPVREGDFVIINPGVEHTEMSVGDVPLEYIILGVEGPTFSFQEEREHLIFSCRQSHDDVIFCMKLLLREMTEKEPDYEQLCQNLLEVLLIRLRRMTRLTFEETPTVKSSRECSRLKKYIETNYTQDITLETLAEVSHLNKYYMVHAFTRLFGCSPINYLCQIRIQASKELLASTDYSITEIAQSSGFSSQSYFAQCFLKHCHMTASAYRKSCREQHGRG